MDEYGKVYDARWAGAGFGDTRDDLHPRLVELEDQVRRQARLASDIASAMGERELASRVSEHAEGAYGGHPWQQARKAVLELEASSTSGKSSQQSLDRLDRSSACTPCNPGIWSAAAALWDDGHPRQAVQTAGQALEGRLQVHAGAGVTGERLAGLFSTSPPTSTSPRLLFEVSMKALLPGNRSTRELQVCSRSHDGGP